MSIGLLGFFVAFGGLPAIAAGAAPAIELDEAGRLSIELGAEDDDIELDLDARPAIVRHTVNGVETVHSFDDRVASVVVSSGAGDDRVRVETASGDVRIGTGAGDDVVLLDFYVLGDLSIQTGSGNDLVEPRFEFAVGGATAIDTSIGNDVMRGFQASFTGPVQLRAGAGDDTVFVTGFGGGRFGSLLDIGAGEGNDDVTIRDTELADGAVVRTGAGDDRLRLVNLDGLQLTGALEAGADRLELGTAGALPSDRISVSGGAGSDTFRFVDVVGEATPIMLSSFEDIDDQALGRPFPPRWSVFPTRVENATAIRFGWQPAPVDQRIAAYRIYRQEGDGEAVLHRTISAEAAALAGYEFTDGNLVPGVEYGYYLRAESASGLISWRNAIRKLLALDLVVEDAPANLEATVDGLSVTLGWDAVVSSVGGEILGYEVRVARTDGASCPECGRRQVLGLSVVIDQLRANVSYRIEVGVVKAAGVRGQTASVVIETGGDNERPSTVTGLAVTLSELGANLRFNAASDNSGVQRYDIYRAVGSGPFVLFDQTARTSWTDARLEAGTSYAYYVRAVDFEENVGWRSNTSSVSTPIAGVDIFRPSIVNVQIVDVGADTTVISWNPSQDNVGVVEYRVKVFDETDDPRAEPSVAVITSDDERFDTRRLILATAELETGVRYTVIVIAVDGAGNQSWIPGEPAYFTRQVR